MSSPSTFGLILLSPIIMFLAVPVARGMLGRRWLPCGISISVAAGLIGSIALGALALIMAIDSLISFPARLQSRYLGGQVASPLSLRAYSEWGLGDVGQKWRYELSPEAAAELRLKCKQDKSVNQADGCMLFSMMDDSWLGQASLDSNALIIVDAAH